jgi:isoquinoline 1-oxidoreductase beta subunit
VPANEITIQNSILIHAKSNRRLAFATVVPEAAKLPVPKDADLTFKNKADWNFVGKEREIYDLRDITTGKAQFGLDTVREGMVFASIEHPPVVGASVKSVDDTAARAVKGVRQTVTLPAPKPPLMFQSLGGVAVIADNTWAAFKGRKALKIEWNEPATNAGFESEAYKKQLVATVSKSQKVVRNLGNVDAEFAKGGKVIEATYTTPMLAHAAMEPPAAVAEFKNGKVEVWTSTQNPQAAQETVAAALGIDKKDVTCHVTLLGGGFGRKSKPDFAAEAAVLSKQLGKPVKVVWNREDDIRTTSTTRPRPCTTRRCSGERHADGTAAPLGVPADRVDVSRATSSTRCRSSSISRSPTRPYDVANIRAENGPARANVRIGWFRAVTNNFHFFALGSFMDELAHAAGKDPLEFLLASIGPGKVLDLKAQGVEYSNYGAPYDKYPIDTRRLRKVLEVAGEKSGWAKLKSGNGKGYGIAAHRSFNTYVASVVHVEMDGRGGFRVPRIDQVVDCGTAINPIACARRWKAPR